MQKLWFFSAAIMHSPIHHNETLQVYVILCFTCIYISLYKQYGFRTVSVNQIKHLSFELLEKQLPVTAHYSFKYTPTFLFNATFP